MNDLTRFPLHTEPAAEASKWTDIGWTDCGEHPSEPGYRTLEWRKGGAICIPVGAWPISDEIDATPDQRTPIPLPPPPTSIEKGGFPRFGAKVEG